jgi:hypothetical protein
MNIEGAEFEILPDLIDSGTVDLVNNLLIQFHNNDDLHELQRSQIRSALKKTHLLLFSYEWVWELWQKKS